MLRAKQVSFQYPQEGHGLPPVSLDVAPGRLTLVTGPSGCGKSTLARCLMGLIPHLYNGEISGEVWLNGYRTTDVPMWQLAEKMTYRESFALNNSAMVSRTSNTFRAASMESECPERPGLAQ